MNESSDEFINFGKYVETLVNQWQLIAGLTLLITLLAGFYLLFKQGEDQYEAHALVASTRYAASVSFGSEIKTVSDSEANLLSSPGLVDRKARMTSYVLMVKNPDIARQVQDQMGDQLEQGLRQTPRLLKKVEGKLAPNSDSIDIQVTHTDPVVAADLANTWARAFVNQVNAVYSDSGASASYASIKDQVLTSKKDYEAAQAELEHFIANNQLDEYNRQINRIQVLINNLEKARQSAITTTIEQRTQAQIQISEHYFDAQTANSLLALQADQDSRRNIITGYINAMTSMRQSVFDEQVKNLQSRLSQAYSDQRGLWKLLASAQDMRDQVQKGGAAAAASNALALTLLKVQVFSQGSIPEGLQIQTSPSSAAPEPMLSDLDGLIAVIKTRQSVLDNDIQKLSEELSQAQTLTHLDQSLDPSGELASAIQSRYPDLFQKSALSDLSLEAAKEDSPLYAEVRSKTRELLELQGLEDIASYEISTTPLEKEIQEQEQILRQLRAAQAREMDQKLELTRARDLAWETYKTLATKAAERAVALQTKGSEVALSVPAAPPDKPVDPGFTKKLALAAGAGLAFSVFLALAIEFWWNYKGAPVRPVVNLPLARLWNKLTGKLTGKAVNSRFR